MKTNFNDLGISSPILKAIDDMGFQVPTEVQSRVIPHIFNQEDLIVMSKTGSGKTAVFGIPLLQMTDPDDLNAQALILTPTRELAVQIDNDLKRMSAYLPHKTIAVYGQHSMNIEIQAFKNGASIVTGTPGRVYDHIRHGNLKVKQIRYLVLDEADRMLDMGFIDQVFKIIKTLPKNRITLLFSATIPPEIQSICRGYMKHPATIEIGSQTKTVDTINQAYYRVNRNDKRTQLHRLLMVERPESCLVFCNTRYAVDQVQNFLNTKGYASEALHGDIPQKKRLEIMERFKRGEIHLLVATDVAARGIHVDDLALVINYDVPQDKDNYVHRIGRTGRAGKGGRAITFVTADDIMSLYEIEEHIGAMIEEAKLPTDSEVSACRGEAESWIRDKYQSSALAAASVSKRSRENKSEAKPDSKRKRRRSRSGSPRETVAEGSNTPRHEDSRQQRREDQGKPRPPRQEGSIPPRQESPKQQRNEGPQPPRQESPKQQRQEVHGAVPPAERKPAAQDSVKNKSLIQRMLNRMLGK